MMGFPYYLNKKQGKIDMDDIDDSYKLHVLFRKINIVKIMNDQFLLYDSPTAPGEGGAALMVKENDTFYLIGLHLGAIQEQKLNFGILFR